MDFHRPNSPTLSLASIARSIFAPARAPRKLPPEREAIEGLQRVSPVLMKALGAAFERGLVNAKDANSLRRDYREVLKAFADVATRRQKLGEAYDVRREQTTTLKVKATSSIAAFNEHSSQIAELASRLRDAGNLDGLRGFRVPIEHDDAAAVIGHVRLDGRAHQRAGGRGVHSVATAAQDVDHRLRHQRMRAAAHRRLILHDGFRSQLTRFVFGTFLSLPSFELGT